MTERVSNWSVWAGLLAGAIAWALFQQAGSSAAFLLCDAALPAHFATGLGAILLALVGTVISLRAWRAAAAKVGHARRFLAALSVMGGALFLLAIALQLAAGLFYTVCQ